MPHDTLERACSACRSMGEHRFSSTVFSLILHVETFPEHSVAADRNATPSSRLFPVAAVILGILLAAVSLLADEIGVSGGGEGIGWKQLIGAIAGIVLALTGVALLLRPRGLLESD